MKKIIILSLTLIVFLFSINIVPIGADSGFDSSWDSDCSWDSGSSSSSDSDWGSDHSSRYDRNSNSSSKSSSNISKTDILEIIYYHFISLITVIVFLIIIIPLTIFLYIKISNYKKKINNLLTPSNGHLFHALSTQEIKKYIPDYDEEVYKNKFYNIYLDIQNAWMNFDYDTIRKLTTDEIYNMYSMQLDTLKVKNEQNVMNNFKLLDFKLFEIDNENNMLTIKTYMRIEMYDYLINTNTKKVVRGTDKHKIRIEYIITFVKSNSNNNTEFKCPNCGAKLNINASGKCPYCDSTIVIPAGDYVMSKKQNIGQRSL